MDSAKHTETTSFSHKYAGAAAQKAIEGACAASAPATGEVKQHWAGVRNLQAQLFGVAGYGLFIAGLSIVRSRLLGVD